MLSRAVIRRVRVSRSPLPKKANLLGAVVRQVHKHHAGHGVVVAGAVEAPHDGARHFGEVGAVAAGGG